LLFIRYRLQLEPQVRDPHALNDRFGSMALPVGEQNLLANAEPLHRRAMTSLGTIQDELGPHL
jgi:hypothetical protein